MKRLSAAIFLGTALLGAVYFAGGQTNIGGTINSYVDVTMIGPCANKITVSNSSGFVSGNSVIIIQMQGATMVEGPSNSSSFGNITDYVNSGYWEKAVIQTVAGNVITLTKNLLNNYTISGKVQMILLPTYSNVDITSTLTGSAWNGSTGGVIALEVTGTLTLNANIDASGIGFRGGSDFQNCSSTCGALTNPPLYYYSLGNWLAAYKGEGIAPLIVSKELGKGRQTNGGGGGNAAANGGGGGGNYATGGSGGNNSEPNIFLCKGNNQFGLGGLSLDYTDKNRLFLGGGGGAGHGDNGTSPGCPGDGDSGEGGSGGGVIILIANTINGNGLSIISKGANGDESWGDAAGGGGGGGAVLILASTFSNNLIVDVSGGEGGDANNTNSPRCFGSGGGGGSGIVLTNLVFPGNVTVVANGGSRGFIINSSISCNNTSTAVNGSGTTDILTGAVVRQSTTNSAPGCGLPVSFIHFSAKPLGRQIELSWATATELDADYFAIERSSNNADFTEIGRVTAAGNTSTRTDYSFIDGLPFPGINYYRLRQADVTGYEKFTYVITVSPEIHSLVKNIYPNPLGKNRELNISFSDPEKDHHIALFDASGRQVCAWYRRRNPSRISTYPLSFLNPGVYLLIVQTPEKKELHKIVVE